MTTPDEHPTTTYTHALHNLLTQHPGANLHHTNLIPSLSDDEAQPILITLTNLLTQPNPQPHIKELHTLTTTYLHNRRAHARTTDNNSQGLWQTIPSTWDTHN